MTNCEECVYYEYDPETDTNYCEADLDEDDMERFLRSANVGQAGGGCPSWRRFHLTHRRKAVILGT